MADVRHPVVFVGRASASTGKAQAMLAQLVMQCLARQAERFVQARHPGAQLSQHCQIGPGTVICAGVIVNALARVGSNVILNTGCSVDHHCIVEDHAHLAPGVRLGGSVHVGRGVLVGIGATVMPGRTLGDWSRVAAGAVVHRDVASGETVAGVPARRLSSAEARANVGGKK